MRRLSLRQHWQRLVRDRVWGMDIHASAWIAPTALIDRTWPRGIHIGPNCLIGEEAVILTHDLTRGIYMDTVVGPNTQIGARAIILPGIIIGRDCVISPGALVTRNVPDGHVATGNPAAITPRSA